MHARIARAAGAAGLALACLTTAGTAPSAEGIAPPRPHQRPWLFESTPGIAVTAPPAASSELAEIRASAKPRSTAAVERIRWWDAGGPAYRWNDLAIEAMLDDFVTTVPATRGLALMHTAIDDAVAAAWAAKQRFRRPRPSRLDASIVPAIAVPESASYPSDHAAAAAAAAAVLSYILPKRASRFATLAEEAMRSRLIAGVEYPSDVTAGRAIGEQAAALAIARGKADGTDRPWQGTVPTGPGKWLGSDPVGASASRWRPWVLRRADEFRPPEPPAVDSNLVRGALAELRSFQRTPATNHRALYWEVFAGARAYVLWNELLRLKLLEYGAAFDAPAAARLFAALNVAYQDSIIACFEAKYSYWYIRPSQLDPDLKPLFLPPNHPSYPAGHSCLSTTAATVLAKAFPRDRQRFVALAKEAGEARIAAGIHYRFDVEQGEDLGRKVADKVLARAFVESGPPGLIHHEESTSKAARPSR